MSVDQNKPLIEMTEKELKATFREIGMLPTFEMLQDARHGKGQDVVLAMAVLTLPDGNQRRVMVECEYGDGEGTRLIESLIEEVRETAGMLKQGERIDLSIQQVVQMVEV